MKGIALGVSVLALLLGVYYALTSLTAQMVTGEHAATLACACFLFVIALGVWKDGDHDPHKQTNDLLEELIRRSPPPTQPTPPPTTYQRPME